MDAYDLVISICALNRNYSKQLDLEEFSEKLLSKSPHPMLNSAGIIPHPLHGDSLKLYDTFTDLLKNRVLTVDISSGIYGWNFPVEPLDYFKERILPNLSTKEFLRLEDLIGKMEK
jgi:hypothetical protein